MSTVAKVLVVLNLVLAVAFLGFASSYLGHQDTWKKKLETAQAAHQLEVESKDERITQLRNDKASQAQVINTVREERNTAQTAAQELRAEVANHKEAFDSVAGNLTRATRAVETMTKTITANRNLIDSLQQDATQLREALNSVQNDRDAKIQALNARQLQLNNETEARKDLEGKLEDASEALRKMEFTLAWYKKRFPGADASGQPAHGGRILAARPDANVYVISLGAEDGVKAGFQYIVSRGSDYVGTIQIEDVQAKQASGKALRSLLKGKIQRGDAVMNAN